MYIQPAKTKLMKRIWVLMIGMVCIAMVMTGCYYDKAELVYPVSNCDTANVKYSNNIVSILSANCYTCHSNANYLSSGGSVRLEGHANLVTLTTGGATSRLVKAVNHTGPSPMPKGQPKLPNCQVNQITAWVLKGAPNN
jgi:hypothetical protein